MKSFIKTCLLQTAVIASISLLAGCDLVRATLGRPTSDDLAAMRSKVAEMHEQHVRDSLTQAVADSIAAAADSLAPAVDTLANASQEFVPAVISKEDLTKQYYVIAGCFSTPEAAVRFCCTINGAGYSDTQVFRLRSDRFAVTCFGCDTYREASSAMKEFSLSDVCPPDIWIYKTN